MGVDGSEISVRFFKTKREKRMNWKKQYGLICFLILLIYLIIGCQGIPDANSEAQGEGVDVSRSTNSTSVSPTNYSENLNLQPELGKKPEELGDSQSQVELTESPIGEQPKITIEAKKPLLGNMTLDVKIGQMLIAGFRGLSLRDRGVMKTLQNIRDYHLGGVILFDYDIPSNASQRNIQSVSQVKALVRSLQSAALQANPPIPLFVAIDQEGGRIQRLKRIFGFPQTYSAQKLGQFTVQETFQEVEKNIARILAELGINFNFAPVVDLNLNPDNPVIGQLERSFSADPDVVIQHALAFINAHHEHGVLCAIKHFPGHGSSTGDSHRGLVDVTETWQSIELKPYQQLIPATSPAKDVILAQEEEVASRKMVDAIITAHVFNRTLDEQWPATLSKKIISGKLRDELGYQGVVISDDMQMGAISHYYTRELAIEKAIQAGIDILILGNNIIRYEPEVVEKTIGIIKQLIEDKRLAREMVTTASGRVQSLKTQWQEQLAQKYLLKITAQFIDGQGFVDEKIRAIGQYAINIENPGYLPAHFAVLILDQPVNLTVVLSKKSARPEPTLHSDLGSCLQQNEYSLTITVPGATKIQILNIQPKYYAGMCLTRGWYDIQIIDSNRQINRWWLKIEDTDLSIRL
jgi:beta-N-acetylhexosaminidase